MFDNISNGWIKLEEPSKATFAKAASHPSGESKLVQKAPKKKVPAQPSRVTGTSVASASVASASEPSTLVASASVASAWKTVQRKKRTDRPVVTGRCVGASLVAAERVFQLHVWRLNKTTTVEDMRRFLQGVEPGCPFEIAQLAARGDYASFKIGIKESSWAKLNDPEVWTEGVAIHRYYEAKTKVCPKNN
jgi:hypothetical protein